jgi:hypothetical protein
LAGKIKIEADSKNIGGKINAARVERSQKCKKILGKIQQFRWEKFKKNERVVEKLLQISHCIRALIFPRVAR